MAETNYERLLSTPTKAAEFIVMMCQSGDSCAACPLWGERVQHCESIADCDGNSIASIVKWLESEAE